MITHELSASVNVKLEAKIDSQYLEIIRFSQKKRPMLEKKKPSPTESPPRCQTRDGSDVPLLKAFIYIESINNSKAWLDLRHDRKLRYYIVWNIISDSPPIEPILSFQKTLTKEQRQPNVHKNLLKSLDSLFFLYLYNVKKRK